MKTRTFEALTSQPQFDIRDVIGRFEELETELQDAYTGIGSEDVPPFDEWITMIQADDTATMQDAAAEYRAIGEFLDDVRGNSEDEQWRGDWYPTQFIADANFEDYARDLAEDLGAVNRDATWPNDHIDWGAAAEALQTDYSSVEIDGLTFWYR